MKTLDTLIGMTLLIAMICFVLGALTWLGQATPKMKQGIERCVIEGCSL